MTARELGRPPGVRREVQLAWLALVAACGAAAPAAGPPPPAGVPEASPEPPPARAPVPETARADESPSQLLEAGRPMWWRVAADTGQPVCRPFTARPYSPAGTGVLEPLEPDRGHAVGTVVGPDGASLGPLPPDPWRRISFSYRRVGDDRLRLHEPRASVGSTWALASSCEHEIALADAPWFATREGCEATLLLPLSLGACEGALRATVADDHGSERLARVAERGGRAWELAEDGDRPTCVAWRFVPGRGDEWGTLVSRVREGGAVTETSYGYELGGSVLTLLGPSTRVLEGGREVSGMALGCGEMYLVQQDSDDHARVGGSRWYFEPQGCRRARRAALAGQKRGGC